MVNLILLSVVKQRPSNIEVRLTQIRPSPDPTMLVPRALSCPCYVNNNPIHLFFFELNIHMFLKRGIYSHLSV